MPKSLGYIDVLAGQRVRIAALEAERDALQELCRGLSVTDAELRTIHLLSRGVKPADLHKPAPAHDAGGGGGAA